MRIATLIIVLLFSVNSFAQFSFSNRTVLLANQNVYSGAPMGVVDMNGDGLDDIVRLDGTEDLVIDYQMANGMGYTGYTYGSTFGAQWSMCIADVDRNGFNDILTGGAYNNLKLLTANGNGTSYSLEIINILPIFLQGSNFVDIDNDGHVDVFACHDDGISQPYRNNGTGSFTYDAGLINPQSTVPSDNSGNYGSVWTDYDNDGDIDLYLSKCRIGVNNPMDGRRLNLLFENDGNNNYMDVAADAGLLPMGQSWATDFADIDNDGDLDAFIVNHDILSGLYENNGFGVFTNITPQSGITSDLLTMGSGIQVKFADFDNDTYVDLLITSSGPTHLLFRNNGNTTFSNLTGTIPTLGNRIHSVATGDLNNDGFVDMIAGFGNSYNSTSFNSDQLFINNGNGNNYLKVALQGTSSNINGIGARIEVYGPWGQQVREVRSGESYGIMTSLTPHFGLGTIPFVDSLVVRWPSGVVDIIVSPDINQTISVVEGTSCVPSLGLNAEVNNLTVDFTDETTIGATQWLWEFGDGETSTEQNPTHIYQEAGIYNVCLTVSGFCGDGQICQSVNVNCIAPQSVFGASDDALTVTFEDNTLFGPNEWLWTFGDATTSNEQNPVHTFPSEGTYFVCLLASNNCGSSQFCDFITVGCEGTEAVFDYQSTDLSVDFSDMSTGGVEAWSWDFGDGTSSSEQNPQHDFPAAGSYTVCLQVMGACGMQTSCETVNVSCALPTAGFEPIGQQLTVAFASDVDDNVTEFSWDFGDGGSSVLPNPVHEYNEAGNYIVCLDATSLCGTTQVCQQVTVVCASPQSAFIHQNSELVVNFTDASSNFPEEWSWTFGDGNSSTSQNPQHEYNEPGNYEVCLQVTSICGQNQVCETISVSCSFPEAAFTNQVTDLVLNLEDVSTNQPDQWIWTFGDGNSSTQQNPEHTYQEPGAYLVCLTAFNNCGSDQICETLNLSCLGPQAQFETQIDQLSLAFSDNSTNAPTGWNWTFGDGNTSTAQNPTHAYALPGTYTVCLTATSICGTDQLCEMIQVTCAAPTAGFSSTTNDLMASFADQSTNSPSQWIWTFGDGNTSTEQNPDYTFAMPGTYEVCLQASSVCGSNISCSNVSVTCAAPQAAFDFTPAELVLNFVDNSTNSPSVWAWTFGDGGTSNEANPVYEYETPGVYQVCLEAGSVCGVTQTCQIVEVNCAIPSAAYTFEANELMYSFTDVSNNNPEVWLWDFGNGETSFEANPTITFDTPGAYEVCMVASNVCGSTQTCQTLQVSCAAPIPGFSLMAAELAVSFQDVSLNDPTEWLWIFGDGETSNLQEPQHTYELPGVYEVCLEVGSICGTAQVCQEISVTCMAPQANFDSEADELDIQFTDISSNVPTTWLWDFGDGNTATEQNPDHLYSEPGTYIVCLQVSSVCGNTERCEELVVSCAIPEASIDFVENNLEISFMDASTNNPESWLWEFGDGTASTEQNPAHAFAEPGVYEVCLTVTSICGMSTSCLELSVSCAAPEAAFSVSSVGLTQLFFDASTNNPTSWFWDFGDGTTSTLQTPSHLYESASSYTVCLIASSICGADTVCQILNIITDTDAPDLLSTKLEISPNPVRDLLRLKLLDTPEEKAFLHVYNVSGQRIQSFQWALVGTENTRTLDVSALPHGLYLLQLETTSGMITRRFVVQ